MLPLQDREFAGHKIPKTGRTLKSVKASPLMSWRKSQWNETRRKTSIALLRCTQCTEAFWDRKIGYLNGMGTRSGSTTDEKPDATRMDSHITKTLGNFATRLAEIEQNISTFSAHLCKVETHAASASKRSGSARSWPSLEQVASPTIGDVKSLNKLARQIKSQPVKLQYWPLTGPLGILGFLDASHRNQRRWLFTRRHDSVLGRIT